MHTEQLRDRIPIPIKEHDVSQESRNTVVERWTSTHPRWTEMMSLPEVIDLDLESKICEWHLGVYTLVALQADEIVGVCRLWTQVIGVDEDKPPFLIDGEPAVEGKVVTFHVAPEHRRGGVGTSLQLEAARWARELGCYQLRSRSGYDREGNHRLKGALGFGISPGRNTPDGREDTAFFVLPLRLDPQFAEVAAGSD